MLFNFFRSITSTIFHLFPRLKSHLPCCASWWVLVSGSMFNSQSDERPDQHTHILTEAKITRQLNMYRFMSSAAVVSTSLFSLVRAVGSGLAPAACQFNSGFYCCVTSVWLSLSGEQGVRVEQSAEWEGGDRGAVSTWRETDMGGGSCGCAESFHIDQF